MPSVPTRASVGIFEGRSWLATIAWCFRAPDVNAVASRLNEPSRKTLNDETPVERFHQSVASTG
ncbi:hypothetical protein FUT89_14660 [Ralstonia pseudosolanacearum]|nr:hypothetical protein RSOE_01110 [Ralstonia solanacearum OE1-1]TXD86838.1 hypothetical protein FUT89_14660 [Ralstonia pseudosolanacearum]